jgi:hypothetical protein
VLLVLNDCCCGTIALSSAVTCALTVRAVCVRLNLQAPYAVSTSISPEIFVLINCQHGNPFFFREIILNYKLHSSDYRSVIFQFVAFLSLSFAPQPIYKDFWPYVITAVSILYPCSPTQSYGHSTANSGQTTSMLSSGFEPEFVISARSIGSAAYKTLMRLDHLGDLGEYLRIILNWILKK